MRQRYHFLVSLPERVVRSLSALSGGLLREIGRVVLPARIRSTALYRTMVEVTVRFLIQEIGQVEGIYPSEGRLAQDFLLRRGASHGIELLGLLTLHVSPIWVLAVLADASGAGQSLICEITETLKREGLLQASARFETVDQLLTGLEKTSSHLAETLNAPPLDVKSLRQEWMRLKQEVPKIPPRNLPTPAHLQKMWEELVESAARENRSVFAVSSLIALSVVAKLPSDLLWLSRAAGLAGKRASEMLGEALLTHYRETLQEIASAGFLEYWKREFRPYLRAAAAQFAKAKESSTERLLKRSASHEADQL